MVAADGIFGAAPRGRSLTLKELAVRADVSLATASLALNNHPRVALKTRQRVSEIARKLGFVNSASYAARRLARSRGQARSASFEQIGFIFIAAPIKTDLDIVSLATLRGAEQQLSKAHACPIFIRIQEREDWEKVRRLAQAGIIDGWLVTGWIDDAVVNRLNTMHIPYVILGDHRCTQPVHCVTVDHAGAARQAVHHLATLGHRRIAFVGGTMQYVYQQQMLAGFIAAARSLGIDHPDLASPQPFWQTLDVDQVGSWLQGLNQRPTAIVTSEMRKADKLLKAFRELGIDVPREVSLVGCEASAMEILQSDLTRIDMPIDEMGRQGAMLLQKIVTQPAPVASSDIRLSPTLIESWSSSRPLS